MPTKEEAAREKLLAKIVKEGGKKGVEIEGASDMGGLDFFCTTMVNPNPTTQPFTLNPNPDPNPNPNPNQVPRPTSDRWL